MGSGIFINVDDTWGVDSMAIATDWSLLITLVFSFVNSLVIEDFSNKYIPIAPRTTSNIEGVIDFKNSLIFLLSLPNGEISISFCVNE